MIRPYSFRVWSCLPAVSPALLLSLAGISALDAAPLEQATVTKIENNVAYGDIRAGRSATRPAAVSDVIRERNFLLTEADSRAELRYEDGSVVRVGQNAVFTFDADTRTLSLEKGTLLFHIPKGSGGGRIKTPSLTAAITGTSGKVSANIIAITEGQVRLTPSGQIVNAGEFARRNPDGTITIAKFDPATVLTGKLVNFNGVLPGFEEQLLAAGPDFSQFPGLDLLSSEETLYRTQNLPGSINKFFPQIKEERREEEEEPVATPTPTPRPVVATPVRRVTPKPTSFPTEGEFGDRPVGAAAAARAVSNRKP